MNDIQEDKTYQNLQRKTLFTHKHTSHPLGQLVEEVCGPVRRGFRVDFIVQRSVQWLSVMLSVRGEREVSRGRNFVLTLEDWRKRGILGQ